MKKHFTLLSTVVTVGGLYNPWLLLGIIGIVVGCFFSFPEDGSLDPPTALFLLTLLSVGCITGVFGTMHHFDAEERTDVTFVGETSTEVEGTPYEDLAPEEQELFDSGGETRGVWFSDIQFVEKDGTYLVEVEYEETYPDVATISMVLYAVLSTIAVIAWGEMVLEEDNDPYTGI